VAAPAVRVALAAALVVWTWLGLRPLPRPAALPASTPTAEFSAERAMTHVRAIAQRPHPVGSPDHDRVRDYVRAEFARLGVDSEVETGIGAYHGDSSRVENIVGRLPGTANTRPVMLAAHYDSVRAGPGAGDDGHAVAAILETLRALRGGTPLRNDVLFLITDGEELGMLGAALFVHEHRWRAEPGVVLNFEARGTGGASNMFETSLGNGWLINNLRAAVPQANASSFAFEVYRRMPNDTDLSVFKQAGLAGMNFAFIEHPEWYHSRYDDPEHLDLRSLQEQGRYALALTRQFGGLDLRQPAPGDAVYFPTLLTSLIVYPVTWVKPLVWTTLLALVLAAWIGWRRRASGVWIAIPLAIPAVLLLLVAGAAPGVSYLLEWPLTGGLLALAVLLTAPPAIGFGWRAAVLLLAPAPAFLLIASMMHAVLVALGNAATPIIAAAWLLILVCVLPQVVLLARSRSWANRPK
jgi:hypothetical protein